MSGDAAREEVSAGGVVVRLGAREPLFLVVRDRHRNWGFPKGHVKRGESAADAAHREVIEETGLAAVTVRGLIDTIDWRFTFNGRAVHKRCHLYLMETAESATVPQRSEGITACRWAPYDAAARLIAYANARAMLGRARTLLAAGTAGA